MMIAQLGSGYDEFDTPPPFKVCPVCEGTGYDVDEDFRDELSKCGNCHGTGRIPIWYTIPQWEELTGRKVPDDMPVYVELQKNCWSVAMKSILSKPITYRLVIITEAGKPPKDWRPE